MSAAATAAGLLLGLLLAAAIALHAVGPAWRFSLEAGKSRSSTISVKNRCHAPHSFRVSASPTLSFVTFRGPMEFQALPPGQIWTVTVEFTAIGLQPRLYQGDVVVHCLDCLAEPRCTQETELLGVEMTVVAPAAPARPVEELGLLDLTLELFWRLASVDAEKPGDLVSLLAARPEDAAARLRSLEIYPTSYDDRVASMAAVIPRLVFAERVAELLPRAHGLGLNPEARLPSAPPMIFRGRSVALLVIFEPRTGVSGRLPSRHTVPAVFIHGFQLPARWASEAKVDMPYDAQPLSWTPGAFIDHTWCDDPTSITSMIQAVTKLTYGGGGTDTERTDLPLPQSACPGGPDKRAVKVRQRTRQEPPPPVIIASEYLIRRTNDPTTVFAVPVTVPRKDG